MSPLLHLDYPLNIDILLKESKIAKKTASKYGKGDPRMDGNVMDNWLISKHTSEYIEKIMDDFEVLGKPRFYWLEPNSHLIEHVDYNTTCGLNFILSSDIAPVTFQGVDYYYKSALLNTQIPHSVTNGKEERLLLKISIFNETFEELSSRIKYKANVS